MTVKRVAVDLRMVGAVPHGIARYALGIWNGLPPLPDLCFTALCSPEGAARIQPLRPKDTVVTARRRFLSPVEQVELPLLFARAGVDLFHATSFSVPAFSSLPLVLTLHDATHLALPEHARTAAVLYHRAVVRRAARRAVRVLTVSEFSAAEIGRHYGVARERILVAPDAIDLSAAQGPASRLPAGITSPYLLYVGNGKPHKNVELLLAAHGLLRDPPPLFLCGAGLEGFARPGVYPLKGVSDDELVAIYRGATLFLFPSLMEGFGLPPLEAAACGAPVLVADGSALREIWTGVAPLLPPHDAARWAETITALLADEASRRSLAERCRAHAARFCSWQPAVDAALEAYRLGLRLAR
jgi:glycosyltransferase involved in cell wall biosynthesis